VGTEGDRLEPMSLPGGNAATARLFRSASALDPGPVPDGFADRLPSGGQPIPAGVRQELESGFGTSLDEVRVHTEAVAADRAGDVSARAFTVGSDVYFGRGEFRPESPDGYRLLAHEVAHTMQQRTGSPAPATSAISVSEPESPAEREADAVADVVAAARGTVPPRPLPAMLLAYASGVGGNGAASRLIARQPAPPATAATITQLDEALAHSNVDEDRVIDILGRLSPPDKARVLAGGYASPLANALNNGEMVRAVKNLGAPLWQALEWVKEAAGKWSGIEYAEIAGLVRAAQQADRDVLKTTAWRDRFVEICSNDTMYSAVIDLGFDVQTKLAWMLEEGTSYGAVAAIIRTTPADQVSALAGNTALMNSLRSDLSSGDYATIEKMVRSGLLGESDIEREYVGNEWHVWAALTRSGLTLSKHFEYKKADGLTDAQLATVKAAVQTSIARHLNGKWRLRIASVGAGQQGDGDYPITFQIVEGSGYPVTVHPGNGRAGGNEDSSDWYEQGQVGDTADTLVAAYAHELSHIMVGAPEEYVPAPGDTHDPGRTITHDDSIMGQITSANALRLEIKDRALAFLALWAHRYFPGRRISIVR